MCDRRADDRRHLRAAFTRHIGPLPRLRQGLQLAPIAQPRHPGRRYFEPKPAPSGGPPAEEWKSKLRTCGRFAPTAGISEIRGG